MPGASRNWILCCSCSQEAVPGANVAELQTHWGRLNFVPHRTRRHDAASEFKYWSCWCVKGEAWRLQMTDFAAPARWRSSGMVWFFFYFSITEFRGLSIATTLQSGFSFYCEKTIFLSQQLATYIFSSEELFSVNLKCLRGFSPFGFHQKI